MQTQTAKPQAVSNSKHAGMLLQRKCACGSPTSSLTGSCPKCQSKKIIQTKLSIGASDAPLEREADRVADQVVANNSPSSVSSVAFGRLQREEAPKEKTNEEKYKEGLEKLGGAFLKTPLGKELLEKIKQDTLVKGATELGKDFISTWPGKIVTGAAATGAVAALAATHKALPAQIPEIPLDVLMPGLSVQLTYKGPVDKPTEAMITFKFTEQAPKGRGDKKPMSATDKFRAETARLAAENAKFRAGMTYMPGSPEDLQQKAEQESIRNAILKYPGGPDIEATIKKYPWLATPQPKTGLQLIMPKLPFGIKSPALLGDEFKLKPPGEQKKKEDEPALQKKLSIGASNDPLEDEADRIADQVMAAPAHSSVSGAPLRIQRFTGQAVGQADAAPASVDRVLASSGRPLEPTLRQDMEHRFGYDFSRVRVHSGVTAEQSARDVNAKAYAVGPNVVFGTGRFAPGTHEGRRLIAHELTHVVQQSGSDRLRANESNEKRGLSPVSPVVQARRSGLAAVGGSVVHRMPEDDVPLAGEIDGVMLTVTTDTENLGGGLSVGPDGIVDLTNPPVYTRDVFTLAVSDATGAAVKGPLQWQLPPELESIIEVGLGLQMRVAPTALVSPDAKTVKLTVTGGVSARKITVCLMIKPLPADADVVDPRLKTNKEARAKLRGTRRDARGNFRKLDAAGRKAQRDSWREKKQLIRKERHALEADCSLKQQKLIDVSLALATSVASSAIAKLGARPDTDPQIRAAFTKYMKLPASAPTVDPDTLQRVVDTLATALNTMLSSTLESFDCPTFTSTCDEITGAFVNNNQRGGVVSLCPKWLSGDLTFDPAPEATEAQAYTLLHEFIHLSGPSDLPEKYVSENKWKSVTAAEALGMADAYAALAWTIGR